MRAPLRDRARAAPPPPFRGEEPRYLRPRGNLRVRRRRRRRTALRVALWCGAWLAGAGLAAAGFRQGWSLLTSPDRFPLHRVVVEGGGERVDGEVTSSLAAFLGRNVLTIDLRDVERISLAHQRVRSAAIHRRLPSGLHVLLTARRVEALVLAGERVHMVDASGTDMGRYESRDALEDHPVLTGVVSPGGAADRGRLTSGIEAIRRLRRDAPEFAAAVSSIDLSRRDRLTATLRDFAAPIYLCSEDPLRNLDHLAAVRERLESDGVETEYIDLRFKDRIAVMPIRTREDGRGA